MAANIAAAIPTSHYRRWCKQPCDFHTQHIIEFVEFRTTPPGTKEPNDFIYLEICTVCGRQKERA